MKRERAREEAERLLTMEPEDALVEFGNLEPAIALHIVRNADTADKMSDGHLFGKLCARLALVTPLYGEQT